MERKSFIRKSVLGAFSGGFFMLGGPSAAREKNSESEAERRFREAWITSLMENLEKGFEREARSGLMHACGRDCARRGAVKIAESFRGDVRGMVEKMSGYPGLKMEWTDGRNLTVTYEQCFCELVGKGPERLPDTYCECSKGWLLEMFGTAAGKEAEVEILETLKRGGSACRFVVKV